MKVIGIDPGLNGAIAVLQENKVKSEIEKKVKNFSYSGIEWRPYNYLDISKEQTDKIIRILESLDKNDDIQSVFLNCKTNL